MHVLWNVLNVTNNLTHWRFLRDVEAIWQVYLIASPQKWIWWWWWWWNLGIIFNSASAQHSPPPPPRANGQFGWVIGHPPANAGRDKSMQSERGAADCSIKSVITGYWRQRASNNHQKNIDQQIWFIYFFDIPLAMHDNVRMMFLWYVSFLDMSLWTWGKSCPN